MMIHKQMGLNIYFGDASSCPIYNQDTQFGIFCEGLRTALVVQGLVVQKQTHGVVGRFIDDKIDGCCLLEHEGDYLATNQKNIALGVLTADCLPIVLYDPVNCAVAAVHAGWKGSIAGIAEKAFESLVMNVGTKPSNVQVFFGPAAKVCCYEVQQDFCDLVKDNSLACAALIKRDKKTYFDKVLFNKSLLVALGANPENINEQYNQCTMCTDGFHSHRRSKGLPGRQLTCAWLSD